MLPTLIYYGSDDAAAKKMAEIIRSGKTPAQLRHAMMFDGAAEPCASVMAMPDVSKFDLSRLYDAYGEKVSGYPVEQTDDNAPLGYDSGEQFSDSELRDAIREASGRMPGPRTSREKLVEVFNELNAAMTGT